MTRAATNGLRGFLKARDKPKFFNERVTVDGETFDSAREASYYRGLLLLARAGKVRNIVTKPTYILLDRQVSPDGEAVREVTYSPDFRFEELVSGEWILRVDDVKFTELAKPDKKKKLRATVAYQLFQVKRKLMLQRHGIWVRCV